MDFVVCESGRPHELIRVCADPTGEAARMREEESILIAKKELGTKKAIILTLDFEKDGAVQYSSAWKWMLG